ncbi:Na(+)/H(+) antiporter subunit B [Fusibacter sp. JL216-2]|uniref:Na(+)/H(+) antiporter subunit B n=1 Tax=Fusibacter sp. JL216-2 TaxID=3071453 RepID=UPI003D344FCD
MKEIALISLIFFALMALGTQRLRLAVIYLGVFSMSMAFVFIIYNAPDVAIAEAVIGSVFSSILYLVALKKYKVFTVYCHIPDKPVHDEVYTGGRMAEFIKAIEVYCAKEELEPLIIYTAEKSEEIMNKHKYEVILEDIKPDMPQGTLKVICHPENLKVETLRKLLRDKDIGKNIDVTLVNEVDA